MIKNPCLGIGTELNLKANETIRISFIFGYADQEKIEKYIIKYEEIIKQESILEWNTKKWKNSFIELNIREEPWLSRETRWHSYYTRSTAYFDEYFENHVFPQGSIYQFGHGLDGAVRDYILYLYSIIFLSPSLAKEYLSYILSLMDPNGELPYSRYGFAKFFTGSVHSKPSDLYLFLIWGILKYVYTIRDFNFLNEEIPFYPKALKRSSTVLERIYIALKYLFSEEVGFGEHGLIKSNDGDWSDGISLMVKSRKKFIKYGESNFNSTFALYILPKLITLLEKYNSELADLCKERYSKLKVAFLKSFNGKWYYRGWDGQGNPIGDENIYLEHHTWLLISELLDKERAKALIQELHENLDNPSPIGQYISYPAQDVKFNVLPKGWDVNGGVWHAMNALLTWGYSKYDLEKAFNSLKKNSMAKRAEVYPNIWYGIWSGPDAYIADYAENAGQAFYHLTTPMCDFPLLNLNIHACYLLSVIKMAGIEEDFNSITIAPKIKDRPFQFKSPIMSIDSNKNFFSVELYSINTKDLILKIEKPSFWSENTKIILNNNDITNNSEAVNTNYEYIIIRLEESYKSLTINLSNK